MRTVFYLIILSLSISCTEYTPKPRGFYRIDLPVPTYKTVLVKGLPYSFRTSKLARIELPQHNSEEQWINIIYPDQRATFYCTYRPITHQSYSQAEMESRKLLERSAGQADKISEKQYENEGKVVYATLFLLEGDSPSPIQFTITDKRSHFFRGALYYDCKPNADSLAPVTNYLKEDIMELIQSFQWK